MVDVRLKHPFPLMVSGPTMCGKTSFVRKLLELGEEMIDNPPEKIVWCYGEYQPVFEEMKITLPNIEFVEGIPSDLNQQIDPTQRNLVVLDDLMSNAGNNKDVTNLVTRGCHHRNMSLIYIQQNLFPPGKESRSISLNCHYICMFSNPRDRAQVNHLARQMYPGKTKFLQEAYADACCQPYGYLFLDLKQDTPEQFRVRTNIFPDQRQYAYVKKRENVLYNYNLVILRCLSV